MAGGPEAPRPEGAAAVPRPPREVYLMLADPGARRRGPQAVWPAVPRGSAPALRCPSGPSFLASSAVQRRS